MRLFSFFTLFIIANCQAFAQGNVKPLFHSLEFADYERNAQNNPEVTFYIIISNDGKINIADKRDSEVSYHSYTLPDSTIEKLNTIFNGNKRVKSYKISDKLAEGDHYAGDYTFLSFAPKNNKTEYLVYIESFMSDDFNEAYSAIIKTFSLRENEVREAISIPNTFLTKLAEYDKKAVNLPKKELPPPAMPN